ncbi:hypothetical protein CCR83_12745 [Rhodobacter veldkampii DSM 11550]|uniref:Diguanylate cyclase n=1 Tax=Phaeovulum veldkampii DSM 11550 TaxID=1185920 RepID=A0A2T4JJ85_9RHOB|nr:PAS-domain containing protein [Phaeovulum veldkampii]MBK5947286.1 hypothetical protein [Phaeovulum veldkampii DSM 11550]PTE17938.1 diguanylate cyclase [Phaeovulum veldkampii DSM 11550]TDQ56708.1 PAS domain-containing protein [Phaeovulum veldkampii DSM 11550]
MLENWGLALVIVASSVASALIALMLISLAPGTGRRRASAAERPPLEETVFLFDDQLLIDATPPARALLEAAAVSGSDWARLLAFLSPRFGDVSADMASLADRGRVELVSRSDAETAAPLRLLAEDVNGLARITLIDPEAEGSGVLVDGLSQRAMEDELAQLRATVDALPALAWREGPDGAVTWANRAYLLHSDAIEAADDTMVWPLPRLFDLPPGPATAPRRCRLGDEGEHPAWFDCYSVGPDHEGLHFALPADAAVRAERSLREFVQTLSKTFADLPIGLAVFDRQRLLQMFNPALVDLMQLGPDFLSARPTLYAFLDRLRETRMMPEPRDYRSWRQQMTELEQAASAGYHAETWSLSGGQTYRVTGRPHPGGAVAFLFEDISAEVSLTRRFRAELELGQEVLDALEEAVAVFLPSGDLVNSNAAYARLWGVDPSSTLGRVTVLDAARVWHDQCRPTPIWAEARDFVVRLGDRAAWFAGAELTDGRTLSCRFVPLSGGATLAGFRLAGPLPAPRRPAAFADIG